MAEPLNPAEPIVNPDGTMKSKFRDLLIQLTDQLPLEGSGSPEGVLFAPQYSTYLDTAGGAGSIEYRKMLPDIAGDKTKGWVQV